MEDYEELHHLIYDKLINAISTAKSEIKLSTYSIVGLNNLDELIQELQIFLKERRGTVKIFCRAMNHRTDHISACIKLNELGVEIFGDMFNHSKGISIDDSEGIIFTANIDGNHGLKSGFEVGYSMNNSHKSFGKFNSFLNYQLETAPFIFRRTAKKQDVFEFYKLWYSEKEINPAPFPAAFEIKYFGNKQFALDFANGITNFPIFYSVLKNNDNKKIQFEINGKAYLLNEVNYPTFKRKGKFKGKMFFGVRDICFFTIQLI